MNHCSVVAITIECVWCREISAITTELDLLEDSTIVCVMLYQGFKLFLDVWVLQSPYN